MVSVSDVVTERCACAHHLSAGRKSVVSSLSMQARSQASQAGCISNRQQIHYCSYHRLSKPSRSGQQVAEQSVC